MNKSAVQRTGAKVVPDKEWITEEVYFDGDSFFRRVLDKIQSATTSVEVESYIFMDDELGRQIVDAMKTAASRGVWVRVAVDAIGSPGWERRFANELESSGVRYRVYHRLPWDGAPRTDASGRSISLLGHLRRLNRRNHRKLIVVDGTSAFVGSLNVSAVHLSSVMADRAWRDTGLEVSGNDVQLLREAFDLAFMPFRKRLRKKSALSKYRSELVRLNSTRKLRRRNYQDLLNRLDRASSRIWITTPYFVPNGELLDVLTSAASRGVDVRLLVPYRSDVFFMPWVAAAFVYGLLQSGARVWEYEPSVLHAKTLLIDDWATIGSSNFNHRSMLHDLEVDVVVSKAESRTRLADQFLLDLEKSRELTVGSWFTWSSVTRFFGRVLLLFREWL